MKLEMSLHSSNWFMKDDGKLYIWYFDSVLWFWCWTILNHSANVFFSCAYYDHILNSEEQCRVV